MPPAAFPARAVILSECLPEDPGFATFDDESREASEALWYRDAAEALRNYGIPVNPVVFPAITDATSDLWTAFLTNEVGLDESTLVIAHGLGAACLLRVLSDDPSLRIAGAVLVAAYCEAPEEPLVLNSGLLAMPLDMAQVRQQAGWWWVCGADDDPYVPADYVRRLADELQLGVDPIAPKGLHFETAEDAEDFLAALPATLERHLGPGKPRPELDGTPGHENPLTDLRGSGSPASRLDAPRGRGGFVRDDDGAATAAADANTADDAAAAAAPEQQSTSPAANESRGSTASPTKKKSAEAAESADTKPTSEACMPCAVM